MVLWYVGPYAELKLRIEVEKIRNLINIKHTLVRTSFTKIELKLKRLEI